MQSVVSRSESGQAASKCRGSARFLRNIHALPDGDWLAGSADARKKRGGSKLFGESTVPFSHFAGRGEHYLDPARIDAKGSETRMSRRGDVVDGHEFDLVPRDRGRGHHLRNESEPLPCAERHGNQDALDAHMRTYRSEQLFVGIDAGTAKFVDYSRFRSVEGAYSCLRNIFDV